MKLPFKVDLSDKVAAITGGGGVLMSEFGRILALNGAKVALLDINADAARAIAEDIEREGGRAIAVKCDCLDKASIETAKAEIEKTLGKVNMLINGAGGNSPKGTTDIEFMTKDVADKKTFFDLDGQGLRFVFDLNILSAFLVTWFCKGMVENRRRKHYKHFFDERIQAQQDTRLQRGKAGVSIYAVAVHFAPATSG